MQNFPVHLCSSFWKFFEITGATCVGSFCHWAYNLDCRSYQYQNSPSESPLPCFLPDSFGVFDPEISLTMFEKQHIPNTPPNVNLKMGSNASKGSQNKCQFFSEKRNIDCYKCSFSHEIYTFSHLFCLTFLYNLAGKQI